MHVVIVVRMRLVGEALRSALGEGPHSVRVVAVGDGDVSTADADVVLLSARVTYDVAAPLVSRHPGRVIVFGGVADPRLERLGAEVVGDDGLDRLRLRLDQLAAGDCPPAVRRRPTAKPQPRHRPGYDDLTEREAEVLDLMLTGADNPAIAGELDITVNTVRTHVQNIFSKLGVHSRFEAVTVCLREGAPRSRGRSLVTH